MNKEKNFSNISITIKSILLGLGFYFLIRVIRNNYYFPLFANLQNTNPAIYQILTYLGHTFFLVGLIIYFYFVKDGRHCLNHLKFKLKDILYIFIGLILGFIFNGSNILMAFLHGDIDMVKCSFDPSLIIISFFAVMLQSSVEEMQYRMWTQKRILFKAPLMYAIIGSAFSFAWSHMLNTGITFVAFINLILHGILYSLFLEITGDIWMGCACHAAWNFTQNFIFGLPNSGYKAMLTMMEPTFTKKSLFYNPTFGVEATVSGMILNIVILLIFFIIYKNKNKKFK